MQTSNFSNYGKGTLFDLLMNAYSVNGNIIRQNKYDWKQFDNFVFDNLSL